MNKALVMSGIFVLVALGIFGLSFIANPLKEDKLVIYFPIDKDFTNSKEGLATFEFKFPEAEFKVGDETADILMFLDSETIPGLKILYNQKDMKIYAGIPSLVTEEVTLLDGQVHRMEYAFNKDKKQQAVSLDGNILASGEYSGDITVLTGYVVYENFKYVESDVPIQVSFE